MSLWRGTRFRGPLPEPGRQEHPGWQGRCVGGRKVAVRWRWQRAGEAPREQNAPKKYGTRELQFPGPLGDLLGGADEMRTTSVFGGEGDGAAASEAETAHSHVYGLHTLPTRLRMRTGGVVGGTHWRWIRISAAMSRERGGERDARVLKLLLEVPLKGCPERTLSRDGEGRLKRWASSVLKSLLEVLLKGCPAHPPDPLDPAEISSDKKVSGQ
ncbi:hypothetical protein B0H11DRAFT_1932506 [Mycena galericulata]|nr:hypothetical protein B0H11DRAFT_1932506 [Mycena galericulata]